MKCVLVILMCLGLVGAGPTAEWEVFAFVGRVGRDVWSKFDWSKLTTIVLVGNYNDTELVEFAHSKQVKAVAIANIYKDWLPIKAKRDQWIKDQLELVRKFNLDGINFDFEEDVEKDSPEAIGYTALIRDTVKAFKGVSNDYQISVDLAWSPDNIDGRFYQVKEISKVVDLIFVMSYDEQSQMPGQTVCTAGANSPLAQTAGGLTSYLSMGVPANKLVLGLPWYGYIYPCTVLLTNTCRIQSRPFRGVKCSDAAGKEYKYRDIAAKISEVGAEVKWSRRFESPYFNFYQDKSWYQG